MFKLLRRIVSQPLFPFGAFLLPEAIIAANYPALKKKKKHQQGLACNFPGPSENCQSNLQRGALQGQGRRDKQAWVLSRCVFIPWPHPCHPHPLKKRELPARSHIKEYFLRSHRDAEWSCWVISAANKWCQAWHFLAGRNRTPLR